MNVTDGTASIKLYSVTASEVTVTGVFTDPVAKTTAAAKAVVTFKGGLIEVSSFKFQEIEPAPPIPLRGSATVTFKALDSANQPVRKLPVVFSISSESATLDPVQAETRDDGTVSTTLTAKTIAASVTITVAAANDESVNATSPSVNISGGAINAKNLSLVCPHYSIGGFDKFGLEMECTVYASDYDGAFVPNSQVSFKTEAGGVPTFVKLSNDPAKGGFGKITYRTQCQLPRDVPPMGDAAGDPGNPCSFPNPCGTSTVPESRTCNPRDGYATLVAISTGGEAFQDANGNGDWDPGEDFTDLPEPFVDSNDNGTRDNDVANGNVEDFLDYNNNKQWDDKNGKWDAYTAIWTSVRILWTGPPTELTLMPGNDSGSGAGGASPHCTTINYKGYLKDLRGNPPTAANAADKVKATCTNNCKVTKTAAYSDGDGLIDVTISDAHGCPAPCNAPGCMPTGFSVDFQMNRTLDTKGTKADLDELNKIIGTDPAPRQGVFE
ncbi:MAG: Ig-like domain-containing protein [Myxococcales bacterium]